MSTYKIKEFCKDIESDPAGISQHVPGAKLDKGKPDMALVLGDFSKALWEVCRVGTYGATKYTESGWLSVPNAIRRYDSAKLRHAFKRSQGEVLDNDTQLMHAAHEAWNSLAVLELLLREDTNGS